MNPTSATSSKKFTESRPKPLAPYSASDFGDLEVWRVGTVIGLGFWHSLWGAGWFGRAIRGFRRKLLNPRLISDNPSGCHWGGVQMRPRRTGGGKALTFSV